MGLPGTYKPRTQKTIMTKRGQGKKGPGFKETEKKLLFNVVLLLLMAGYFIYYYLGNAMTLKDMHGAEWITGDAQGRLYFVYHGDVHRFDPSSDSLTTLIQTGVKTAPGDVMDLAVNPAGNIVIADPRRREIRIYTPDGGLARTLPGAFRENAKIAADDKRIYLADMQGNRVIALDIESGNIAWENTGYFIPDSLDLRNNVVYVSDKDEDLVRLLAAEDGRVITDIRVRFSGYTFGSTILALNDKEFLLAQAYSRDGLLQKHAVSGELLQTISGPAGFSPADMTAIPTGEVIVTDETNYALYRVQNGSVTQQRSGKLRALFEGDLATRSRLKSYAAYTRLLLLGCVAWLIGIFVYYRKSANKTSTRDVSRYGATDQRTAAKSGPAASPAENQEMITIRPKEQKLSLLFFRLLFLVPLGIVLVLKRAHHDMRYWGDVGIFVLAASVMCTAIVRELSARRRGLEPNARFVLKLTPQGFYVGDKLHAWHTIETFGVQGGSRKLIASVEGKRLVYWKYKSGHKKGMMRFLAGYDAALEPRYEMEPAKIAEYLNAWKTKYTGRFSEIETGKGLHRNLSAKDVGLLLGIAVLIVAAFVAVGFMFGGR